LRPCGPRLRLSRRRMAMARVTAGTARTRGNLAFGMTGIGTTMAGVQQQRRLDDAHPARWFYFIVDALRRRSTNP
jgi:hypothetical protein